MPNYWIIFTTGLLSGGLTCLAVQGGLLASVLVQQKNKKSGLVAFLLAKLLFYALLGAGLGLLGSAFVLSVSIQAMLQLVVSIFMLGTALALLDVHPVFRYFIIQPPRFLTRIVRNESKSKDYFAPLILGAMTVFVPCGTTQAMMALAISTGNPINGALVLFSFVLGTLPVFAVLGYTATKFSDRVQSVFRQVAAVVVLGISLVGLNNSFVLLNWPNARDVYCGISVCNTSKNATVSDTITIKITKYGYDLDNSVVKAGSKVKLRIVNEGGAGCQQALVIPKLSLSKVVPPGGEENVEFTAPAEPGNLNFSCSMGMYSGSIKVI